MRQKKSRTKKEIKELSNKFRELKSLIYDYREKKSQK